ncbi:hypothetical protein OGM63_01355 [Plectonema radiosum NIES-515]|uniref:AMP-dependent synthetase and ligase n=1 Tax=Plectonema radiosum NIES-515 TaxID=2986073 RepID=A0ABT3AT20_9CYAN|nr:hypothetical protein [Plectonema radiosum]MCV3212185.1 hypothetical protein [Plectonema radiosum NIES-515]
MQANITDGDGVWQDEDGYFWIMGRVDDVLNVSGLPSQSRKKFKERLCVLT